MPLYDFFEEVRSYKILLGIDDYLTFLDTLAHYATKRNESFFEKEFIFRLCKLLWLKPQHQENIFREIFEKHWKIPIFNDEEIEPNETSQNIDTENKNTENPNQNPNIKEPKPNEKLNDKTQTDKPQKQENTNQQNQPNETNQLNENTKNQSENSTSIFITPTENNQKQEIREIKAQNNKFYFHENYIPFQRRNIGQKWRFLKKNDTKGESQEIDTQKTIKHIIKTGVLQKVFFKPYKNNTLEMITLIEHKGGMIAFKNIALELANSAKISAGIDNKIFFFQEIPHIINISQKKGYCIYTKDDETEFDTLENIFLKLKKNTPVMIISDAGAVSNYHDDARIQKTKRFLNTLKKYTQKIVWLNPMPEDRRINNSAEIIQEYTTMYEANEEGLKKAIKLLRGKITY